MTRFALDIWEEDGPLGVWIMRVCPVCGTEVYTTVAPLAPRILR